MSTNFPAGLDDNTILPTVGPNTGTIAVSHAANHDNANDAIKALETKVGITSSADTTSLDYKVSNAQSTIASHVANTSNPHSTTKAQVGLGNADNTSDATKVVLSAGKLTTARTINGISFDGSANITIADSTKEPIITAGTTSQYWRGDKSFQTLDKTAVGLPNVDNTSDVNKPVSTAQNTAITAAGQTAAWGSISGTLASQTDLSTALASKPYSLQMIISISAPTDATTYLSTLGFSNVGPSTEPYSRIYIPKAGTLKWAQAWAITGGTAGSSETSSIYLTVNNTTDYLITSSVTNVNFGTNALWTLSPSITVNQGDFICFKWITPTWATNPGSAVFQCSVLIY